MKLNLNRPTQSKSALVQPMDFMTYYKVYLQSYLRWLYEQNKEFSDTLSSEEITNFLLKDVIHPVWFEWYCANNALHLIADTTTYLNRYKKHAKQMAYRFPIRLKSRNPYVLDVQTQENWDTAEASDQQDIHDYLAKDIDITNCLNISTFDVLVYQNSKRKKGF